MHLCGRCGRETNNYFVCDKCIDVIAEQMVKSGRAKDMSEAVDLLYESEVEVYHSSYRGWVKTRL